MPKKACTDPKVGRFITAYVHGDVLKPWDVSRFEIHVLLCDHCAKELKKLLRRKEKEDSDEIVR